MPGQKSTAFGMADRGRGRGRGDGRGGRGGFVRAPVEVFRPSGNTFPPPDPAVKKTEDDFLKNASNELSLSKLSINSQFPHRPAHGSQGKSIVVFANYLPVRTVAGLSFYQYHVDISALGKAPTASKAKTKRLMTLLLEDPTFRGVTSDFSSQLVSRRKVEGIPRHFDIPYRGDGEDRPSDNPAMYRLTVQETGTVSPAGLLTDLTSTNPGAPRYGHQPESIQCVNIVLGHSPQISPDIATIGQNKYYSLLLGPKNQTQLSPGVLALRGFFKSVRPATSRLLLNVNVSHTVCYQPGGLESLMAAFGLADKITLGRQLKLLRVSRTHLKRISQDGNVIPCVATIWDLATTNDGHNNEHPPQVPFYGAGPKDVRFWLEERQAATPQAVGKGQGPWTKKVGGKVPAAGYVSVWEYFKSTYNMPMDPKLPVVNTGNRANPRYLPAEVCQVLPGQPFGKKLDSWQTRNMIKFACRRPNQNADSIVGDGREALGLNSKAADALTANGIFIGDSLITVPARVLTAPDILYGAGGGSRKISPMAGSWNMGAARFSKGVSIKKWGFLWLRAPRGVRDGFSDGGRLINTVKVFMDQINKLGVVLPEPMQKVIPLKDGADGDQHNVKAIDEMLKSASRVPEAMRPEFILFILPKNDSLIYNNIKRLGDVTYGLQTICVVEDKFANEQRKEQYFANVALKINLKAGGVNQTLEKSKLGIIDEGYTMVVGIDVTHPSPGSKATAPSVAGMVASVDRQLGQWPADLRIQEGKKEMVTDIGEMLKNRLRRWQSSNKQALPRNILIYRDGVSEGQYPIVLDEELPLLRTACKEIYPAKAAPKISIIIVGKRHHTRFFPTAPGDADNSANCRNGTVVDRGVTEVRYWHFYLQAHACLQGTARPAHYFVILDEIFRDHRHASRLKAPKTHLGGPRNAADDLEDLTHNLCHLFGRATKAVSICPPAYYADLLCERARCYLAKHFDPTPGSPGKDSDTDKPEPGEIRVHDRLIDTMFYI